MSHKNTALLHKSLDFVGKMNRHCRERETRLGIAGMLWERETGYCRDRVIRLGIVGVLHKNTALLQKTLSIVGIL